jgi:hypothetical protein
MTAAASRLYSYTGSQVGVPADTAEHTLFSYTLLGGTVSDVGSVVSFLAGGNCNGDTATKILRLKVNGIIIVQVGPAPVVTNWAFNVDVINVGGGNISRVKLGGGVTAGQAFSTNSESYVTPGSPSIEPGIDWAKDNVFSLTAQNVTEGVANSVVGDNFVVRLWP